MSLDPQICSSCSIEWKLIAWPATAMARCMSTVHWENCVSISFHIEWDMIVVTVFLPILNQMLFHLVQNLKENCHHDHILFNVKGKGNIVFSMHAYQYLGSFRRSDLFLFVKLFTIWLCIQFSLGFWTKINLVYFEEKKITNPIY